MESGNQARRGCAREGLKPGGAAGEREVCRLGEAGDDLGDLRPEPAQHTLGLANTRVGSSSVSLVS